MKTITTNGVLRIGDKFTIAGVPLRDTRTRWQRFRDWVLRRPAPRAEQQVFRVTEVVTSHTWPDGRGNGGEYRVDTIFGRDA